jgi:DNA-directed RNA polymerase subunit M
MYPCEEKGKKVIKCRSCGAVKKIDQEVEKKYKLEESIRESEKIIFVEEEYDTKPKTREECPKCKNNEAYYWFIQTRAEDEPATKFYRCTKCGYTWREYD